jgi:hypothetical protein
MDRATALEIAGQILANRLPPDYVKTLDVNDTMMVTDAINDIEAFEDEMRAKRSE